MFVGNIVGVASLSTRLSTSTTGLETESLTSGLQSIDAVLGPAGQFSLDGVTDSLDASGEPFEDSLDITSLLHGNDTELILLIDPDQEGLVGIVENTTAFGPITLHTSNLQVGVTRHEQEMVINELLA